MPGVVPTKDIEHLLSAAHALLLEAGVPPQRADALLGALPHDVSAAVPASQSCNMRRILVAVDFSPSAAHAVETALSLSEVLGAQVAVVHVVDVSPVSISGPEHLTAATLEKLKRDGDALCRSVVKRSRGGRTEHFVRCGNPAGEILAIARLWRADLIVIGSHGRTTNSKFFLGSTVETVVRESDCPVLAVGPAGGGICRPDTQNPTQKSPA